ncbi:MAG: ATP-binding protein [Thermoplasmatota archaeon]
MKFHNRENELRMIKEAVEKDYCFIVITGRRRIGKTRLIREALKGKDHLDLFIPRKRSTLALEQLSYMIREQTGYSPQFMDLRDLLQYIFRMDNNIIFIDEVSNFKYVDEGVFSDLQEMIDRVKDERPLRIIVDGSYVSIMRRTFQDRKEPLYGRATSILELQPLNVVHSVRMLMEGPLPFLDSLETYSLFGGVPSYLEVLKERRSIEKITENVFSPGSIFLTEGENLLIQEFGASWDTYFSILEVISRGKFGPTSIAEQLGMEVQMLPKYLETLKQLQLIDRKRPIFGKQRHVRYGLIDPFLQFWFKVCYPRYGLYRDGRARVDRETVRTEIGKGMERVIVDILFSTDSLPFEPDEVGSWWDRSGNEVDILFYSKREKKIAIGEVKWKNKPVGKDSVKSLLSNLEKIDWQNGKRTEYPFIVSRSGFTEGAMKFMEENRVYNFDLRKLERALLEGEGLTWNAG